MVSRELKQNSEAKTKGEQLFREYGVTGACGEAESGFATVRVYDYLHGKKPSTRVMRCGCYFR
nr:hypothetical protein [Kosakonia oryziphila]